MTDQVEPSRARVGQVIDEMLVAIVAAILEFLEYEAREAKERQIRKPDSVPEFFPEQNYEAREKAGDIELELRVAEISPMRVIARSLIAPFVSFEIREASGEKAEVLAILGRE